ncbi:MAG: sigma-54 dependent transcriptional regulator [Clostridia bacterium]|nr:sigma-54 dependent transcriptional regulator [Clostridia bacterium]
MSRAKIMLVDDEPDFLHFMQLSLADCGYQVQTATGSAQAYAIMASSDFDVAVVDVRMPTMSGIELMESVRTQGFAGQVIVLTGHGSIDGAVEAMRKGAFTYLTKPIRPDDLALEIDKALRLSEVTSENRRLREELAELTGGQALVGSSEPMMRVRRLAAAAAACDSPVLITGESGTGKDVVTRAIHALSCRHNYRLVKVNCAAVPGDLWESEMFGHEKGAFTGAVARKQGKVELAAGGTLFLDEVADIPAPVQPKFLRVLEDKCFERVGGTSTISVDFRLICATNRELEQEAAMGRFREDLYYRVCVIPIHMPALRERPDDIPALAVHFAHSYAREMNKRVNLAPSALELLRQQPWRGNVRELKNVVERAMVFAQSDVIDELELAAHLSGPPLGSSPSLTQSASCPPEDLPLKQALSQYQCSYIKLALARHDGNVTRAADDLGIARETLHRMLRQMRDHDDGCSCEDDV